MSGIKLSGKGKFSFWLLVIAGLSLILVACGGDNASATPQPKDLPRDRIMFLSNRDGWPDLYTVDQSGKSLQRLTESAAAEYDASWSPDGRRVLFTELEGDQASGDYAKSRRVTVVDADGKNRKILANDAFNASWSPDSSKILFVRATPTGSTSSSTNQTDRYSANIAALPQAQPTGQQVAPVQPTRRQGSSTPIVLPTQSGLPPRATPAPGSPFFTPTEAVSSPDTIPVVPDVQPTPQVDGKASAALYKGGLYTAPADGSAAVKGGTPVTLVADNAVEGAWSPDGKRIVYIAGNNDLNQRRSLWLMDADGGNKVSLSDKAKLGDLDVLHVAWSPDGSSLAFTAVDTSRDRVSLYRLLVEGNTLRRLTDYNGSARDLTGLIWAYADYFNPAARLHIGPVWSANSRRIAFADGSSTISVVEADTGNRTSYPVGAAALGQDKDSVLNVTWLPDNRRLVYDRAAAGRNALLAQANYYIFDFFDETLETLDTVNKNTSAIAGPGVSFLTPTCCGVDLLGGGATTPGNATATPKPNRTISSVNGIAPEGKLVYVSGVGQRQLIVNDIKTQERIVISSGLFKLIDFSLSPRNDKIVYMEVGDKYNASLYLTTLDGKQKRKLSEGTGDPDDLSGVVLWSPDGRQVAFQALKGDPNLKPGLYTLTVDLPDSASAAPRLVTDKEVSGFSWSPDSRQLAFKVDSNYYELWIAPSEGGPGNAKQIAQLGLVNSNYASLGKGVAWSPDGKFIALTGPSNYTRFSLWLVSPSTGQVREVPTAVIGRIAGWTPDSSRLVTVVASFSQNTDIQALNLANGIWRQYGVGSGPQISSDGLSVVYYARYDLRQGGPYNITTSNEIPNRLAIMNLGNGGLQPIPFEYTPYFGFKARFYSWSPDGKLIAYYYNNSIYVIGPNGQNPQVIARAFPVDHLGWARG